MALPEDHQGEPAAQPREFLAPFLALACVILVATNSHWRPSFFWMDEGSVALIGLIAVVLARNGSVEDLGLGCTPRQGWWHWCLFSLRVGIATGVVIALYATALWMTGSPLPSVTIRPSDLASQALLMLVYAPVIEELVYRSLLCFALQPVAGTKVIILISGTVFAAMHWVYGNPSPENQLGGFLLAYAYLRSGTIAVPIAMHSAGNAVALIGQLAHWQLTSGNNGM
ncbi:MAG TPA: CPBP family intramembrane glutamic endopeptidase [Planctomycetaceae bacterium]|nr:CPBP family intramembrane glutamic endopeptidase [Planctomycetaceae bacterium]